MNNVNHTEQELLYKKLYKYGANHKAHTNAEHIKHNYEQWNKTMLKKAQYNIAKFT